MDYLKNTEVWRGNKSYMHYEVDKWDIDENSDLYKPLNKKNDKDVINNIHIFGSRSGPITASSSTIIC